MPSYAKPYLTPDQQLALLASRGMEYSNVAKAKECLTRIGYYRLSAYWFSFRESGSHFDITTRLEMPKQIYDCFKPGSHLSLIMDLYVFDKKMRMIVLDAIERVEVAIRTFVTLEVGKRGPLAYRDKSSLHGHFSKKVIVGKEPLTRHDEWLAKVDEKLVNSKEDFAKHFKHKYSGDYPPIWISVELWDFGTLSIFYAGLQLTDRDAVAARFGVDRDVLQSWLRMINDVRNICAHHSRLWNRPLVSTPKWPPLGSCVKLDPVIKYTAGHSRLFSVISVLIHMLSVIHPSSDWKNRVKDHVKTLPLNSCFTQSSAGFSYDWEELAIWQ